MRKHPNTNIEVFKVSTKVLLTLHGSLKKLNVVIVPYKLSAKSEKCHEKYCSRFAFSCS